MKEFSELAQQRRSVRSFSSQEISDLLINELITTASMAPSACNRQPWHFYVFKSKDKIAELQKSNKFSWMSSAACVVVITALHSVSWKRGLDGKDHADIDVAIAADHFTLAAADKGLGTCIICSFDTAVVKNLLSLEDDAEPVFIIPVGYPDNNLVSSDKIRKNLPEIISFI